MGFGTMERREKVKRLNWVLWMGAVLLLGVTALGACPPGSINLGTVTFPYTVTNPGTYCVPSGGVSGNLTINSNDVTIVGETPNSPINGDITISATMNIVLKNFALGSGKKITVSSNPTGLVIEGVTFNAPGGPAIDLRGNEPIIRNNKFVMTGSIDVIHLSGEMGAKIYGNEVIGTPTSNGKFVVVNASYNGLEVRNNRINYLGKLLEVSGTNVLTNSVIRDNDAGVLSVAPAIDLKGSTNVDIIGNTFESTATSGDVVDLGTATNINFINNTFKYVSSGNGVTGSGTNIVLRGNRITAAASGVGHAIDIGGSNWTVEENTIDMSLGGGTSKYAVNIGGVNAIVRANNIVGTKDNPAVYVNATNALVEGNRIQNVVYTAYSGTASAISITSSGGNATIRNNTIEKVRGADAIRVDADNVVVTLNTITQVECILNPSTLSLDLGRGVYVDAQQNVKVQGNTMDQVEAQGILVYGTATTAATNNEIRGNTLRRVATRAYSTTERPWAAIEFNGNVDNSVIADNTLEDFGSTTYAVGIALTGTSTEAENNTISGNTIRRLINVGDVGLYAVGILISENAGMGNAVQGNKIENTGNLQVGIDMRVPNRATVKDNEVKGMIWAGIYIRGGTVLNRITVEGNKLTDNHTGLLLSAGAADLTGNIVTGGQTAIMVDYYGTAPWYKVEGNCFTAPTLARNDGTGKLTAKKNYWGATPQPGVNVIGDVDTSDPLASCPGAPAPTPTLSKNYGPRAGWYMVSVPTTGDTAGIFGVTLHWWNGTTYTQYTGTAAIEPVKGYWANLPANKTVTASGSVPTTDQTVALVKGWNMISVPWAYSKAAIQVQKGTETKSWADAVAAGWVRDTIWGSTTAVTRPDDYQSVTTLDPWYGYWVRALVDGLSLKFAYASRLTTLCVSCLEAKAVVPEGEELPPAPPAASAAEFKFVNVPNPIRDVHTTTFKVLGPLSSMVTEIKVQVFDLTGKLVWEGTASGAELTWHTDDLTGAYLANGVYLYKVYVKVGDAWISSGVLKLVIQR
jgi:hypothetical protein